MPPHSDQTGPGAFIATTDVYDVQTIYELDVKSQEFKEFLVRLRQSVNNIAMLLNIKDTGYYPETEFVCGQAYFPNPLYGSSTPKQPVMRQVFRKVINFGALTNNTEKAVLHGITVTAGFTFTRIYGTSSDTAALTYVPLPYIDAAAGNNIGLRCNANNVYVRTTSNRTNYNNTYIVLEYIKE